MNPSSPARPRGWAAVKRAPLLCAAFMSVYSLTVSSPSQAATPAESHPVDVLLRLAAERDPSMAVVEARAEAAATEVGATRSSLLPRVSASAGYTRNSFATEVEFPGEDPVVITPLDQLDASARLDVPLLDPAGWARLGSSTSCRDASQDDAQAGRQEAQLRVIRAAWDVATAERVVQAATAAMEAAALSADRAKARLEVGLGASVDQLRAEGDLARARGVLATAEADLSAARRALAARTGRDTLPVALTARARPMGALSAEQRPEVQSARAILRCREQALSASRLQLAPTLGAFALARLSNATGFTDEAATWAAGATLTWTPVEGGRRVAEVARAQAVTREAQATLDQTVQEAADALADAEARLLASERSREAADARRRAADAAALDARSRLEAGTGLAVEVSLADREALDAAVEHARAEAEHALAIESLRVAAGLPLLAEVSP